MDKLDGYFAWAKQEKRIAGFNPWVRIILWLPRRILFNPWVRIVCCRAALCFSAR